MSRGKWSILFLLVLCIAPVWGQAVDCPSIVQTVLSNLDAICADTGRNQACYGNLAMDVQPRPDVDDFRFEQVGDIEDVVGIQSMRLSPLDVDNSAWGVALLRLQASLPDTLPGQNVTFLLFGDTELVNAVPADSANARPMQAFYLRTGVSAPVCSEAPQDGLIVQTPEGRGEVIFSVNGVDMALGSTVYFRAVPGQQMSVATLKGSAAMRTRDGTVPIVAGTMVNLPIDENLLPAGLPELPLPYQLEDMLPLPLSVLEDPVEIAPPLDDEAIQQLHDLIEAGQPVCGDLPFLPDCADLPVSLGGELCRLAEDGETLDCELPGFLWGDLESTLGSYEELAIWEDSWQDDFWDTWDGSDSLGGYFITGDGLIRDADGEVIGALDALGEMLFFADDDEFIMDETGSIIGVVGDDGTELFFGEPLPEDFGDVIEDAGGIFDDVGTFPPGDDGDESPDDPEDDSSGDFSEAPPGDSSPVEEALPPGCEPGICTQEPSIACGCVLCGVQCPADGGDSGGDDSGGDTGGDDSVPGDIIEPPPPDDSVPPPDEIIEPPPDEIIEPPPDEIIEPPPDDDPGF